jgi:hypothetical protein
MLVVLAGSLMSFGSLVTATAQNMPPEGNRVMLGVRFVGDGPVISYVVPNGPAFKAGIQVGDEIFSVSENYVLQSSDLVRALEESQPGEQVQVEVRRNGKYSFFELTVMTATRDGQRVSENGEILPPPPLFGMEGERVSEVIVSQWGHLPEGQSRMLLKDLRGKTVCLFLFQTQCTYSRSDGMPLMADLYKRHQSDPDVQFLAIQTSFPKFEENTLANAVAMCEEFGLMFPVGHDGSEDIEQTVCKSLRAPGTPWIVVLDREGIVRHNGPPDSIIDLGIIDRIKRGEFRETDVESDVPMIDIDALNDSLDQ